MNATSQAIETYDVSPIAERIAAQLEALRRRRMPMAFAFGLVFAAALLVAVLWPSTFRSAGTILIEQQEIPEEFVRSAVTSFADQRVQTISQRVMTSTNLLAIIDKHDLYDTDRRNTPREQLIERVRGDIDLEMISADVVDPRRGGVVKATIAFAVAFKSRSPDLAARVANDLVSLYLRENLENRKQLAEGSAQFLASEAERLRRRSAELAQRIADFKRENFDRLPELAGATIALAGRMEEELRDVDARIRALDQQLVFLDSQLVQLSPAAALVTEHGERMLAPADRLKALRAERVAATARYSDTHPDVRRLAREIGRLELEVEAGTAVEMAGIGGEMPDNPAYVQINAQRQVAASERGTLITRRAEIARLIAQSESAQLQMPETEREYRALTLESEAELQKYAEVRQKLLAAQLSQNLEAEQKGERFALIDPPVRPQEPVSPNRGLIASLGLVLAVGAAILVLFLAEALDSRIRGRGQVIALLGEAPLAVLPWVGPGDAAADVGRRAGLLRSIAGVAIAALVAVLLVQLLVGPLDVVWSLLLRRLGA